MVLMDACRPHIDRVIYDFSSTTPAELVRDATAALGGRQADSIAIIAWGQPGVINLLGGESRGDTRKSSSSKGNTAAAAAAAAASHPTVIVSATSIEADPIVRSCIEKLANMVTPEGRLDFLATAAAAGLGAAGGGRLHRKLRAAAKRDVFLTSFVAGGAVEARRAVNSTKLQCSTDESGAFYGDAEGGVEGVYSLYFDLPRCDELHNNTSRRTVL